MYDIVVHGGSIVDGTASPWFRADLAIQDGKIAVIGMVPPHQGRTAIDASGRIVCPGLIDIHTHSDLTIAVDSRAQSTLAQGVTTQVAGNCGVSAAPTRDRRLYYGPLDPSQTEGLVCDWERMGEYLARLQRSGVGTNYATQVGHGNLRAATVGYDNRKASADEIDRMQLLAAAAMEDGAVGLSSGLAYIPGTYADAEEVAAVAAVVADRGGIYTSHIRNQTEQIVAAVGEQIEIARRTGIKTHISHMQPGAPVLGCTGQLLASIDKWRAEGIDVSCDAVPYTIGSTTLKSMLPPWACDGGDVALLGRLRDRDTREKIKADTLQHGAESGGSRKRTLIKEGRWDQIWLASAQRNPALSGKSFREIGEIRRQDPHDALLDVLIEEEAKPWVLAEDVSEDDVINIARHPVGGIMSDGFSLSPEGVLGRGRHHPRSYGAFPRFLRRFVRENQVLTWEAAIHKLTGYAASRFRIAGRGMLREGLWADVLVFDPRGIVELAAFDDPYKFPTGIDAVIVNGRIAMQHGKFAPSLHGRVLRGVPAQ
jgi:N-acyl-D-amino-acid deacylase